MRTMWDVLTGKKEEPKYKFASEAFIQEFEKVADCSKEACEEMLGQLDLNHTQARDHATGKAL